MHNDKAYRTRLLAIGLIVSVLSPGMANMSTAFRYAALGADKVLHVRATGGTDEQFTFKVLRAYRGSVDDSSIVVRSDSNSLYSFGCEFSTGAEYLILLDREGGPYDSGNTCGTVNCLHVVSGSVERSGYDRSKGYRSLKQIEADIAKDLAELARLRARRSK